MEKDVSFVIFSILAAVSVSSGLYLFAEEAFPPPTILPLMDLSFDPSFDLSVVFSFLSGCLFLSLALWRCLVQLEHIRENSREG